MLGAPAEEDTQVGLGMHACLAAIAAQEGRHCCTHDELVGRYDTGRDEEEAAIHHGVSPAAMNTSKRGAASEDAAA